MSCTPEEPAYTPLRAAGTSEGIGGGALKNSCGYLLSAYRITSFHIGATMYPAISLTMGELSLFPAHTPIAIDGVYPMVHASRDSFVVPVFAATSNPGKWNGFTGGYSV